MRIRNWSMDRRLFNAETIWDGLPFIERMLVKHYKRIPQRIVKFIVRNELDRRTNLGNKSTLAKLYIRDNPIYYGHNDSDLEKDYSYRVRIVSEDRQARQHVQNMLAKRRETLARGIKDYNQGAREFNQSHGKVTEVE